MLLQAFLWSIVLLPVREVVSAFVVAGALGGINVATGQRPSRQEISTFQSSGGPAFDLYILALQRFVQADRTSLLSYYQVAGIHGFPAIPWDDVKGRGYGPGYCTHESILFPSWHRPYMALYEQIIWNYAQDIAKEYPSSIRGTYQTAAETLRIPYWDFSTNVTMPDLVNNPWISVTTPGGPRIMTNPLYNYTFNPQQSASDFPPDDELSSYPATVRSPSSSGQSQPELSNTALEMNGQGLHDATYQILASEPDYAIFSNTAYPDEQGYGHQNIENIHNGIHAFVGGMGGHMSSIPFSSFDPIFWLHHANVDRLFAIWQALYPDSYTTPQLPAGGTYTNSPNKVEDVNTALTPFHADPAGTFYTSATVRSPRAFGYTYPELEGEWAMNATQLAQTLRARVNAIYNPRAANSSKLARRAPNAKVAANAADYQWSIGIRADRSLLPHSSLFLHFYLGAPPPLPPANTRTETSSSSFASNLIATHVFLLPSSSSSSSSSPPSSPSPESPSKFIRASIPLTHALLSHFNFSSPHISPQPVLAQLTFRAQLFNGTVLREEEVRRWSLGIRVLGREVRQPAQEAEFPTYGAWRVWAVLE